MWFSGSKLAQITCDSADFAKTDVISNKSGNVRANAVADEVEGIGRRAADLVQVVEQLGDAARAKSRSPSNLTEAGLLHQRAVIHNDDVVLAPVEICCGPTQFFCYICF
jgi:hypothetical protein